MLPQYTDTLHRILYATDASAYRELPRGVIYPQNSAQIREFVQWALSQGARDLSIIPRGAGTSLAGQVVGKGMVMDMNRYMNRILEVDVEHRRVRVEPGIVLDVLNKQLEPYGLFFSPETSTASRCTLGGMVGNNACGSHSLIYGSTRDHLISARAILSNGQEVVFEHLSPEAFRQKCLLKDANGQSSLEAQIYSLFSTWLADGNLRSKIKEAFPDPALRRRNCGYALDCLLEGEGINLCRIIAGSEGTLAILTELTLSLDPLPPRHKMLICAHCQNLEQVFEANLVALSLGSARAVELMDSNILELSRNNLGQRENRFFIKGNPAAIMVIELAAEDRAELEAQAREMEKALFASSLVYDCVRVEGEKMSRVWALRKAALGLLTTMPSDAKPVSVIEDTAVTPNRLPSYMKDFGEMIASHGLSCVYHAHIGTGELHLRPVLNLKDPADRVLFRKVALETALLVKKHRGSLSGEHGDGRLRGEFIPLLYGPEIYEMFCQVKDCFDPSGLLNPGKIVRTPKMDSSLRYKAGQEYPNIDTVFSYDKQGGFYCAIEQCNGAAECRRPAELDGRMCPSFRLHPEELYSTRARANVMRELFTHPELYLNKASIFRDPLLRRVLDDCLSCKACRRECPSNVDLCRLKAELLYASYSRGPFHLPSFSTFLVAHQPQLARLGSISPSIYNALMRNGFTSGILKRMLGFAPQRQLPVLSANKERRRLRETLLRQKAKAGERRVIYFYLDEFSKDMDVATAADFVNLMDGLGYCVLLAPAVCSGRTAISKGLLGVARRMAEKNVRRLSGLIGPSAPLVGIEPSCLLAFRDEYPDLVREDLRQNAKEIAANTFLYDEFILREMEAGRIQSGQFEASQRKILIHGHCHQKALSGMEASVKMLSLPRNYSVKTIEAACCGMAGAYGFEKKHYEDSMALGTVLKEQIQEAGDSVIIAAPGISCRQQIRHLGYEVEHPVSILFRALV